MTKLPTPIPDLFLLKPDIFPDDRGEILESYNQETFAKLGITDTFIQDNTSINKKNVLRGLHFQKDPFAQIKLVSVKSGKVFDVAVDLRPGSPTYGKWFGTILDDVDHLMMYIPKGFAHGFYTMTDHTTFFYKIAGSYYNKAASSGVAWNDPTLNITWPLMDGAPLQSAQDRALPSVQ